MEPGSYRVRIREKLAEIKNEAQQLEGKIFKFTPGWMIELEHHLYPGETAMIPDADGWPIDAPSWIASGDLEYIFPHLMQAER